jgi:ADP-ribosylglycohydrolase
MTTAQFRACILGGAIGDALGMPVERVGAEQIRASLALPIRSFCDPIPGAPCREYDLQRGMYTDDTQAVRATARAITARRELSASIVAQALHDWLYTGSLGQPPRYPGQTTYRAMQLYSSGRDPATCGVDSSTCGAAIRIAPAALWLACRPAVDFQAGVREVARVTHTGAGAIDGALVVAELIRLGLAGKTPSLEDLERLCSAPLMIRAIARVRAVLATDRSGSEVAQELGGGTGAHEVIPMSLFHLYRSGFRFRASIESGLDTLHPGGIDMDSILGIVGAVAGLQSVDEVLESEWLSELEDRELLIKEAEDLSLVAAGVLPSA